jgi:large repetitive protein
MRIWVAAVLMFSTAAFAGGLTIEDGVVIKFGSSGELVVRERLTTKGDVTFTSAKDDTIGGQVFPTASTPAAGDWKGLRLDPQLVLGLYDHPIDDVRGLEKATIKFAQVGLDHRSATPLFETKFVSNQIGLRITGSAPTRFEELSFRNNLVAIESQDATATILGSEFLGNTSFAARNTTPTTILRAERNWWGAASGPLDPLDNPNGQGDRVSAGVNYANFLTRPALIDCVALMLNAVDNGNFNGEFVEFQLRCRNAVEVRLSENPLFTGVAYEALTSNIRNFTLSAGFDRKTVYVQFRGAAGQTRTITVVARRTADNPQPSFGVTRDAQNPIVSDRIINFTAQAQWIRPIVQLELLINRISIGADSTPPYEFAWNTLNRPNGFYSVDVRLTDNQGQTFSTLGVPPPLELIEIRRPSSDVTPPDVQVFHLDSAPITDGMTITAPGIVSAQVTDVGDGIESVRFYGGTTELAPIRLISDANTFGAFASFRTNLNGPTTLQVRALDRAGNITTLTRNVTLAIAPPSAPTLLTPEANAISRDGRFSVSGEAQPGANVQLYLNGKPLSAPLLASTSGSFGSNVEVTEEGVFSLSADASNHIGTSPRSPNRSIRVQYPQPTLNLERPSAQGIPLINEDGIVLSATVVDPRRIARVRFLVDGETFLSTNTGSPFHFNWRPTATTTEGEKIVQAEATIGSVVLTKTGRFRFARTPAPPAPFLRTFLASGVVAVAQTSFGDDVVVITGRLRLPTGATPARNTAAVLALRNGTIIRKISIFSDADGNFRFEFRPRLSDEGRYDVTAVHPLDPKPFDAPTPTGIGNFVIDRIRFESARYLVRAPRGFSQGFPITLKTSAGNGSKNVSIALLNPAPNGITFTGGVSQAIPAASAATFNVTLSSTPSSSNSGSLILKATAVESNTLKRAQTRVDFELYPASPDIRYEPNSVYTGVRRGQVANEVIRLDNRGLVAANNVRFELLASPNNPLPSWVTLVSQSTLASFLPGADTQLQLRFAPGPAVQDGIYEAVLRVNGSNMLPANVLLSAAVVAQGEGRVKFKVEDIFTDTLDAQGNVIVGVANARVTMQSEAIATQQFSGSTNAIGEAVIGPLPPGRYTYRVSGPRHAATTGRVFVRPGITVDEPTFIDYQTVSFTWSVTPTTISTNYNVNVTTTFQTLVPAPVLVLTPQAVNLPDMQVGETISGEFTLTNHGLLRADNVRMNLPEDDAYFRYEFQANVPDELAANQRVVIPYSLTLLQPLPGSDRPQIELSNWLTSTNTQERRGGLTCERYGKVVQVEFDYQCANEQVRNGAASSNFFKVYGVTCSTPGTPFTITVNNDGAASGYSAGPPGNAGNAATSAAPACAPDCDRGCICAGFGCLSADLNLPNSPGSGWGRGSDNHAMPPSSSGPGNQPAPPAKCAPGQGN